MKRNLLLICCLIALSAAKAQLPYSKLLTKNATELKEAKFEYNEDKNQYVLTKTNGWTATSNFLSAFNGKAADIRPNINDYIISIQEAKDTLAYLEAVFYKDETYHEIENWILNCGAAVNVTNANKSTIERFSYEGYNIELRTDSKIISSKKSSGLALSKSVDESYNVYTYIISTGIEPYSTWHEKQKEKAAKREAKGKKKDINDLM